MQRSPSTPRPATPPNDPMFGILTLALQAIQLRAAAKRHGVTLDPMLHNIPTEAFNHLPGRESRVDPGTVPGCRTKHWRGVTFFEAQDSEPDWTAQDILRREA